MEFIEMINVKSFSELEKQKALELFLTISIKKYKELFAIRVLQEQNMTMDFIVCLHWEKKQKNQYSDIGDKLTAALKNYGWISRSVWQPVSEMTISNREKN